VRRLIVLIRKWNRARVERRAQRRASGEVPRGWFSRLVYKAKARNHDRLARRRLRKHLLASLAANDTAVLEALVFILKTSRQDQRARAEADEAVAKRLAAFEERLDEGVRLVSARIQALEARLVGATAAVDPAERSSVIDGARPRTPEPGGNGVRQSPAGAAATPAEAELAAIVPKRERL
jgi:hypothetical protein